MNLNKRFFHILLLLIGVALLTSCSINQRIKKADKRYAIGEYYEAGEIYRSCYSRVPVKEKKLKGYVAFQQGECYRLINGNPTRALNAYKNAIRYKYYEQDSIVFLRQAQLMQQQGKYSEAQKSYEAYLQTYSSDYVALSGAYACKQMAEWKKQKSRYKIQPVKEFNQKRTSNFSPAYIGAEADAIVFTSNRTPASKKTKKNSSITGVPVCALYSTRLNAQGQWEDIEKILDVDNQESTEGESGGDSSEDSSGGGDNSNGSGGDSGDNLSVTQRNGATEMGVCCFSADGKTMYFTYSKPINGKDQGAKIYMSNRASGEWGEPQEVTLKSVDENYEGKEADIAKIWKELLSIDRVDRKANFFEIGGDSLLATRFLEKVHTQFGVEISLREIFENAELDKLACILDTRMAELGDMEEGEI